MDLVTVPAWTVIAAGLFIVALAWRVLARWYDVTKLKARLANEVASARRIALDLEAASEERRKAFVELNKTRIFSGLVETHLRQLLDALAQQQVKALPVVNAESAARDVISGIQAARDARTGEGAEVRKADTEKAVAFERRRSSTR